MRASAKPVPRNYDIVTGRLNFEQLILSAIVSSSGAGLLISSKVN